MKHNIIITDFEAFTGAINSHERTYPKIEADDLTWIAAAKIGDFTPTDGGAMEVVL